MAKKIVFLFSILGTIVFFLLIFSCGTNNLACSYKNDPIAEILQIFIAILIFMPFISFLKDPVSKLWLKFVYVWVPLSMLVVFLAPVTDSSLIPLDKSRVSLIMSALFLIISLVIIIIKSIVIQKSGK